MEQWEYDLRDDIFNAFLSNNRKAATFLIEDLIGKKSGGLFYRYRPLDMAELSCIRFDQIYFCRAIRFDSHAADESWIRFKSYVSCFTDRKNSLHMWSDYANEAHGMCLEYSYEDIAGFAEENELLFSPVRYSNETLPVKDQVSSFMSMMNKPLYESDEAEWRLWKIDLHSSDIGKLMASIHPRKIILGHNADPDSYLIEELEEIAMEKDIELIQPALKV